MDSIIVKVNLLYNKVAQISFYNKFLGKFNDIGIGSTLGTFMDTYPTAQYDDDQNFFIFLILRMRIWLFSLKNLILLRRTTS